MRYHDESEAVTRPRLLDQVRLACRTRHYSLRTERAYVAWPERIRQAYEPARTVRPGRQTIRLTLNGEAG